MFTAGVTDVGVQYITSKATKLHTIDVTGCNLSALPAALGSVPDVLSLEELSDAFLIFPSINIFQRGQVAVKQFLAERHQLWRAVEERVRLFPAGPPAPAEPALHLQVPVYGRNAFYDVSSSMGRQGSTSRSGNTDPRSVATVPIPRTSGSHGSDTRADGRRRRSSRSDVGGMAGLSLPPVTPRSQMHGWQRGSTTRRSGTTNIPYDSPRSSCTETSSRRSTPSRYSAIEGTVRPLPLTSARQSYPQSATGRSSQFSHGIELPPLDLKHAGSHSTARFTGRSGVDSRRSRDFAPDRNSEQKSGGQSTRSDDHTEPIPEWLLQLERQQQQSVDPDAERLQAQLRRRCDARSIKAQPGVPPHQAVLLDEHNRLYFPYRGEPLKPNCTMIIVACHRQNIRLLRRPDPRLAMGSSEQPGLARTTTAANYLR